MTFIVDGTNGGFFPSWTTATRPASPAVGQMGYNTTTGQMDLYNSSGWTSIPATGGTVPGNLAFASGTNGITFNNSSAITNSKLNDYETGTWTPTVTSSSGTITTVGTTVGQYTKVGNLVTLNMFLPITTNGTGAGQILVSNLPFTINSTATAYGVGREGLVVGFGIFGYVNTGDNKIYLQKYDGAYPGGTGYGLGFTVTYTATF